MAHDAYWASQLAHRVQVNEIEVYFKPGFIAVNNFVTY